MKIKIIVIHDYWKVVNWVSLTFKFRNDLACCNVANRRRGCLIFSLLQYLVIINSTLSSDRLSEVLRIELLLFSTTALFSVNSK